jgi:Tol biopolymer transport system component
MPARRWIIFFLIGITVLFTVIPGALSEGKVSGDGECRLLPADYDVWGCDWSPDESRLIFSGKIKGEDSTQMRIWLWRPPDGKPVLLTNTESLMDASPRWSPAGDSIIMVRRSRLEGEANGVGIASTIWRKSFPDGRGQQLTHGNEDKDPFWSPTGDSIVFVRGRGPYQANLMIMDKNGGNLRYLTQGDNLLGSPFWGSDGWIYYTRYQVQRHEVTAGSHSCSALEIERGSIERIHPDNGRIESIVADDYDNRSPSLSPDGRYLAYISTKGTKPAAGRVYDRGALAVMNMKDRVSKVYSERVGLNSSSPVWTPTGDKIAFFSYRQVRPTLWVIPFNL